MSFTKAPVSAVITDAVGNTINLGNASGSFTAAPLSIVLTDVNGNTLNVGPGVVAKVDATAQQANIGSTLLYAVPAGAGGAYRITAYAVMTQAATTSATLPNVTLGYTDMDTNAAEGFNVTASQSTNGLGICNFQGSNFNQPGTATFYAKAGTNITYSTTGYASSGATPMQYAIHIKLEYLGA